MTYRWLFDELLCFSTFLCSQMSSSHSSHWWQRWSTSISSLDPFKADLDDLSTLFERSRILETTTWEHVNYSIRLCWWIKGNYKDPIAFVHSGKEFAGCFIRRNKNTCFPLSDRQTLFKARIFQTWPSLYIQITVDRKIRKPVQLPEDFDGKQPLKEYLMHFERCAIVNGCYIKLFPLLQH